MAAFASLHGVFNKDAKAGDTSKIDEEDESGLNHNDSDI